MGRRKDETKYRLPREVYQSVLWDIRSYRRYCLEYERILSESPAPADGQPRGGTTSDPTLSKVIKLDRVTARIKPIEQALVKIPEEYRAGIMAAIIEREVYPDFADRHTWAKWRQRFVYWVAFYKGEIF